METKSDLFYDKGAKFSSYATKAAVNWLSPVIIFTSWDELVSSWITAFESSFKGHSEIMNPQNTKSFSASSLVIN